jgi:hypothetical protein
MKRSEYALLNVGKYRTMETIDMKMEDIDFVGAGAYFIKHNHVMRDGNFLISRGAFRNRNKFTTSAADSESPLAKSVT